MQTRTEQLRERVRKSEQTHRKLAEKEQRYEWAYAVLFVALLFALRVFCADLSG